MSRRRCNVSSYTRVLIESHLKAQSVVSGDGREEGRKGGREAVGAGESIDGYFHGHEEFEGENLASFGLFRLCLLICCLFIYLYIQKRA